jgi:diaminobutyrate-2-oxoglutarate transaminase
MITEIKPQSSHDFVPASIFSMESEVRYYSRIFPSVFSKATGAWLWDTEGKKYLDFFCGSGSLNYGHSNPVMKKYILEYLENDGIINSLDQLTEARVTFMNRFNEIILRPRNFVYKMQFCGPTGTNSIEAAMKLARKYTGREKIIYFEHSFHGMSYGSMSVSGMRNRHLPADYKKNVVEMPFGDDPSNINVLQNYIAEVGAANMPAAIILETIQAEGGIRVATREWLQQVAELAAANGILLIIDDIQAGCGRTGNFFSFDHTGIQPDIICLSKSLSGYGFPLSINLLNPAIDCWQPAEHNGTFRGNNLAFIAGAHSLIYWENDQLQTNIHICEKMIQDYFNSNSYLKSSILKGKGLMRGIEMETSAEAEMLQKIMFNNGLLLDICGYNGNVLKIMPPLTIGYEELNKGLEIIGRSVTELKTIQ